MATCGVCIETISDEQQITCLTCKTNFHLNCVEDMMENGSIKKCARCQHITERKKARSIKTTSSKRSSKSVRSELELLQKTHEVEKRQLAEREEFLKQKHEAEMNFLRQQSVLLNQIEENESEDSRSKVESWLNQHDAKKSGYNDVVKFADKKCSDTNLATSTKKENLATSYAKSSLFQLSEENIAARKVIDKELPIFTGKSTDWPFFLRTFNSSTQACKFTNDENLSRLRNCLEGPAHAAVKNYLTFPELVPKIIDTLETYFGKSEYIINDIIQDIRVCSAPKIENCESIIQYSMMVDNLCLAFNMLDRINWNHTILYEVVQKLPATLQYEWASHKLTLPPNNVSLNEFSEWLRRKATVFASIMSTAPLGKCNKNSSNRNRINVHMGDKEKKECIICSESCSRVLDCTIFKEMSYKDKMIMVNRKHLCFLCLKRHKGKCNSGIKCKIDGCSYNHNTILHKPLTDNEPVDNQINHHSEITGTSALFKVLPVTLHGNGVSIRTYAFLDDGSSLTVIEESLSNDLNLDGPSDDLCIRTTGNVKRIEKQSRHVRLQISSTANPTRLFNVNYIRTVRNLNLPEQTLDVDHMKLCHPHIKDVPLASFSARPRILIGLNNSKLLLTTQNKTDNKSDIVASKTCLGWVVYGFQSASSSSLYHLCDCQLKSDEQLNDILKNFYTLESSGICPKNAFMSDEDQRAQRILENTTKRKGHQYECGLLWKFDDTTLPNSYQMALQRLKCLEKKFENDKQIANRFHDIIEDYWHKGYIRELSEDEVKESQNWYLPVFTVQNPNKPEKLRIVWDAAAKVRGVSLNMFLLKGPDLISNLIGVLLRFRERRIAIAADISEMFHQIKTKESDQKFQRFLYRKKSDEAPKHYAMTVMTFGATCSPCIAQHIKNVNADKFHAEFPRAVMSIKTNHYVDDMLDCCDTESQAIQLAKEVKHIHSSAGFHIRGWVSNSSRVVKELDGGCSTQKNMECSDGSEFKPEKILGMFWNTQTDCFQFSLKFNKGNINVLKGDTKPTKRDVLRILMSIYDPLGLLGHSIIFPKVLMQRLWRLKLEWDELIPDDEFTNWKNWLQSLDELSKVNIPRWYGSTDQDDVQMHVFVDGSEEAYSAVIYLRVKSRSNTHCALLASKAKVAPLRSLTVPRLELLAALTGVRLANSIKESLSIKVLKTVYWCDSMTVLNWISSDTRNYKQFVASRICEILDSSEIQDWKYIASKDNVADDSTRMRIMKLDGKSRWFNGPSFLMEPEENWPAKHAPGECSEELRPHAIGHLNFHNSSLELERYSSWNRMLRVQCYVLRFLHNLKARKYGKTILSGIIKTAEYLKAEESLYKHAQSEYYLDEICVLEQNQRIPKSSEIYFLNPFLDTQKIMRSNGRLQQSNVLNDDARNPIILPRDSRITRLVLHEYHERFVHINFESAINEVRQKFFVINLRAEMKKVRKQCQYCKNKDALPLTPMMSPLPLARVTAFIRPFSFVGLDFFGPFYITVGRHSAKRWGVMFTCLSIRAIHLEIAHTLTTDSCIQSILRFMYRRGQPLEFYSDNGTNLRGASKELLDALKDVDTYAVAERFMNSSTCWKFNPPLSPNMGGSWEVMVRLVKRSLDRVMPTRNPNEELFKTCLTEVEFIVNSRPLSYIPITDENSEAITPNHLLLGSSSGLKPITSPSDDQELLKNSWKKALQIGNNFWKRFVKEVLPTLLSREKWRDPVRDLKVGDIVLVIDEKNSRCEYPRGKIIKVHPSETDGVIRKATVQTASGIYLRPASKLAILRVEKSSGTTPTEVIPGGSDNSTMDPDAGENLNH